MSVAAQLTVLGSHKVRSSLDTLRAPEAKEWDKAEEIVVGLEPTPLDRQPSAYVRAAWRDRRRGDISSLKVRSLTTTSAVALRLEWAAPRPVRRISDYNVYADACAVLLPGDGATLEHETMGSPEHPVEAWYWRAGSEDPFVLSATGIGTTQRASAHSVVAGAGWDGGCWQVVLARPLKADGVGLAHGDRLPVAFAVWSGVAGERAGLKSFSPLAYELAVGE